MNAPNLVYATVAGMYPRLLGDDGIHEPLVLPYSGDVQIPFQFYREGSATPLSALIVSAKYIRSDGVVEVLQYDILLSQVQFPETLPAGGVCIITLSNDTECYPFRVLRPTELLKP